MWYKSKSALFLLTSFALILSPNRQRRFSLALATLVRPPSSRHPPAAGAPILPQFATLTRPPSSRHPPAAAAPPPPRFPLVSASTTAGSPPSSSSDYDIAAAVAIWSQALRRRCLPASTSLPRSDHPHGC